MNNEISTHTPLAGRDRMTKTAFGKSLNFNSHAPRGARLYCIFLKWIRPGISTHTPLAGRDGLPASCTAIHLISTHTPLAGRDAVYPPSIVSIRDFNSHAPRGARPCATWYPVLDRSFQLTRPSRGATGFRIKQVGHDRISTHTPLAGRDS